MKTKTYTFLFFIALSQFGFGQLVPSDFFNLGIIISENGKDYDGIIELYKKHID